MKKTAIATLALGIGLLPWASSEGRTIQFGGMATSKVQRVGLYNPSATSYGAGTSECHILIANTGNIAQQIIDVEFATFTPNAAQNNQTGNTSSLPATGNGVADWLCVDSAASSYGSGWASYKLGAHGICLIRTIFSNISGDSQTSVCAGNITVSDPAGSTGGSVIASGSIYMSQEAAVAGGTLSGAFYASGYHLNSGMSPGNLNQTNYPSGVAPTYPIGTGSGTTFNMNTSCYSACSLEVSAAGLPYPKTYCDLQCGTDGTTESDTEPDYGIDYQGAGSTFTGRAIQGYLEPISPNLTNNALSLSSVLKYPYTETDPWDLPPYGIPDVTPGTTPPTPIGGGPATAGGPGITDNIPMPPSYTLRTANAHYNGGMVYEMIFGPSMDICSANALFANQPEFTHADGGDSDAVMDGNVAAGSPPERLFCAHRHVSDELYMGVGSVTSFMINAGSPF